MHAARQQHGVAGLAVRLHDALISPCHVCSSQFSLLPPLLHNARVGHGTRAVYVTIRLSPPLWGSGFHEWRAGGADSMLRFDACEVFSFPLSGKTNCCCTFLVQQRLTGEQTGRSGLAAFLRLSLPRTPLLPSWKFLICVPVSLSPLGSSHILGARTACTRCCFCL